MTDLSLRSEHSIPTTAFVEFTRRFTLTFGSEKKNITDIHNPSIILEGSNNQPQIIYHTVLRSPYQLLFSKMTPYVVHDDDKADQVTNVPPQKPKSIMVTTNGYGNGLNGTTSNGSVANGPVVNNGQVVKGNGYANGHTNGHHGLEEEDVVESPDSLPSRSSVSGRSIIGNGKNGRSRELKR
ncbi:hypothetical protein JTE90_027483 [Oedothorax gibbosus]|uniref:Uncharacterized protein n=1 Tax=Oedothorax gibbosus TaxID=931172 RepID=A0AAV6UH35_9ARAC|nr:hypothetical protein JTE90_027483 [Oedothorax gibbosus]